MKKEDQQDATIRCLLLISVSTCFGHHYVHLQENKDPVTAFGVFFWFCWMWLVAVVVALRCRMRAMHVYGADGAVRLARHHPHRTHDLRSGFQDHHPSTNSVQKTICCNSTSNAPDDGRMCPKHAELRIHQQYYLVASSWHFT